MAQEERALSLRPTSVPATAARAPAKAGAPPRELKVRVYCDLDYQAQVLRWEQRAEAMVRSANEVLRYQLNTVLVVESVRSWERRSATSTLGEALDALRDLDDGQQVDWVLGLVSALQAFSANHHQLGSGELFGAHLVLRAMEDLDEAAQLADELDHLPPERREQLYQSRRRHQESAVLLHELGHTLGAFHVTSRDWLMAPFYNIKQTAFPGPVLRLLSLGLERRTRQREPEALRAWATAYVRAVEDHPWEGFDPGGRAKALARAQALLQRSEEALAEASEPPPVLFQREEDAARYNQAVDLLDRGDLAGALLVLDVLSQRVPDHPAILELRCLAWSRKTGDSMETQSHCQRAARNGGGPWVWVALTHALRASGDEAGARESLLAARKRMERTGSRATPQLWGAWADAATALGQLSLAEASFPHLAPALKDELALHVGRQRRWLGVPHDAGSLGLKPEDEGAYVGDARSAHQQLARSELRALDAAVKRLEATAPRLPGTLALRCAHDARLGRASAARRACQAALGSQPDNLLARVTLAELGTPREAVVHLAAAVEAEPTQATLYARLAEACRRAGDVRRLEAMKAAFRQQFGKDF